YESVLTERQAEGLRQLMDLSDNDLMDLLLARKEPEGDQATPEFLEVLGMLRTPL
ncbi:MAG TPA: succinate dehydrogenase assembly factor 2, partial [Burkholderiaceae bacterium]|nr:succinate dehydrogenase assembly factor 2 [Burkholderiaceae bacterium]